MVTIIEKPVFNLYLDMLCVRPDRAKGGVGGCGSSHESVIGPDGMAAFPKYFPYLVIEPVKGEYHSLPGVNAYTMTAGSNKSLCLNPFWFPKEAVCSTISTI